MKWGEKTVEYYFVKKYIGDKAIAPLAGDEEKAGDAILGNKGKFILIEFKRDEESLDSEKKKFTNYEKAKKKLRLKDKHHLFIYGTNESGFDLKAKTYFSGRDIKISEALRQGVSKSDFDQYLDTYLRFKNKKFTNKGGDGDGGVSLASYEVVAMVREKEGVISCMKLSEYVENSLKQTHSINLEQEPSNDCNQLSSPSMGM